MSIATESSGLSRKVMLVREARETSKKRMGLNRRRHQKSAAIRGRKTKTMYGGARRNMGKGAKRLNKALQ